MILRTIPPAHVAAIREDAPTTGDVARVAAGIRQEYVALCRQTLRIGEQPVRDWRMMDPADRKRAASLNVVYMLRGPFCRACGQRIGHGARVIRFTRWYPEAHAGDDQFIHETCPQP